MPFTHGCSPLIFILCVQVGKLGLLSCSHNFQEILDKELFVLKDPGSEIAKLDFVRRIESCSTVMSKSVYVALMFCV